MWAFNFTKKNYFLTLSKIIKFFNKINMPSKNSWPHYSKLEAKCKQTFQKFKIFYSLNYQIFFLKSNWCFPTKTSTNKFFNQKNPTSEIFIQKFFNSTDINRKIFRWKISQIIFNKIFNYLWHFFSSFSNLTLVTFPHLSECYVWNSI